MATDRKARQGLNFGWLIGGIALAAVGGAAAWWAQPVAEWEAIRSAEDPRGAYAFDPWPGRIVAGGEFAAGLGVVLALGGLLDLRLQQIRREISRG